MLGYGDVLFIFIYCIFIYFLYNLTILLFNQHKINILSIYILVYT